MKSTPAFKCSKILIRPKWHGDLLVPYGIPSLATNIWCYEIEGSDIGGSDIGGPNIGGFWVTLEALSKKDIGGLVTLEA